MATKHELERKPLFRLIKVLFWISALIVVGLTIGIWYMIASQNVDASQAYFVCNGQTTKHPLSQSQKSYIQTFHTTTFAADQNTIDEGSVNMTCYQEYSGKDPNTATNAEIQDFRTWQTGSNGVVYTIGGIQHNWYWGWLVGILIAEYFIFQILKTLGLYVAGGREALE